MLRQFGIQSIKIHKKLSSKINTIAKSYAREGGGKIIKIYYMY